MNKSINILFLTSRDQSGASSQVRVYQFVPFLEKLDVRCTVKPLFTKKTIAQAQVLYDTKNPFKKVSGLSTVFWAFFKRTLVILGSFRYDVVVVQKDALAFGLQELLFLVNKNVIYEFDDTLWELTPDQKRRSPLLQKYYQYCIRKFHKILRRSKIVLAENEYLADYSKKFNDHVAIISAPIDTEKFHPSVKGTSNKIVIGWIGSSSTTYMFECLREVFVKLATMFDNVQVYNVGGNPVDSMGLPVVNVAWNNDTIVADLGKIDIGIMPLDDDDSNKGRLGYKMIIYLALGIPTVAQDVGLNRTVITNGENGFLVKSHDDWITALSGLIQDAQMRRIMGDKARALAQKEFDIRECALRYKGLFEELKKF